MEGKAGEGEAVVQEEFVEPENAASDAATHGSRARSLQRRTAVSPDTTSLGIREPVYEVIRSKPTAWGLFLFLFLYFWPK